MSVYLFFCTGCKKLWQLFCRNLLSCNLHPGCYHYITAHQQASRLQSLQLSNQIIIQSQTTVYQEHVSIGKGVYIPAGVALAVEFLQLCVYYQVAFVGIEHGHQPLPQFKDSHPQIGGAARESKGKKVSSPGIVKNDNIHE
jgi:hypothetical protein